MARRTTVKPATQATQAAQDGHEDLSLVVEALDRVTQSLVSATERLSEVAGRFSTQAAGSTVPSINIWEDDPFSEAVATATPSPGATLAVSGSTVSGSIGANPRLRTEIVEAKPAIGRYQPGTAEFRYWLVAESLARGIEFWDQRLPNGTTWSTSNPMRVRLVEAGADLNARYMRASGLHFYRQTVLGHELYSGESPDVVCHELGHAILDALKPQLFNVASTEAAAFHESFGDMSAILCALQIPSLRDRIIRETNGRLNVNSRLSRLAEQLGWGIRQVSPSIVDRDSLRNAANAFFYRTPESLPPSAPANLLSREPHSLSRVFTGAFLDALATMLTGTGTANEASLLAVSRDMGQLLVDGVHAASVSPGYFSQVAAAMVQSDRARFQGRYRSALTSAFTGRGILSVDSAMALDNAPVAAVQPPGDGLGMAALGAGTSRVLGYEGVRPDSAYADGFGMTPDLPRASVTIGTLTVDVYTPESEPLFEAHASAGVGPSQPLGSVQASRVFLEGLIQRGEIDPESAPRDPVARAIAAPLPTQKSGRPSKFTHLLAAENGKLVLRRNHFNCGCCQIGPASGSPVCA